MQKKKTDLTRRRLLAATSLLAIGAGGMAVYPLVASWMPSPGTADLKLLEVDISRLSEGSMMVVDWARQPVWIIWRSPDMLQRLRQTTASEHGRELQLDSPVRPEIAIFTALCTHLGCVPIPKLLPGSAEGMPSDWQGGFVCPCHGAAFDLAGRPLTNSLTNIPLQIPPHVFLSETRLLIGTDEKPA